MELLVDDKALMLADVDSEPARDGALVAVTDVRAEWESLTLAVLVAEPAPALNEMLADDDIVLDSVDVAVTCGVNEV